MIPFPEIRPEIVSFEVFGVELALRWYALSYIVGFFIALFLMKRVLSRENFWGALKPPITPDDADGLLTYLIIGVILGGRLGYVIFYNSDYYFKSPIDVFRIWDGGMSFHGGFLGVIFAVLIFCWSKKSSLWSVADVVAFSAPPGLFLGRLANFINAELWGRPTLMPWGVSFPGVAAQTCPDVEGVCARHPSQLYEALLEGPALLALLIYFVYRGMLANPGFITGVFSVGYGLARFYVEYFRVPDPQFFSADNIYGFAFSYGSIGLTMGQALSVPMILIGLVLIWRSPVKVSSY